MRLYGEMFIPCTACLYDFGQASGMLTEIALKIQTLVGVYVLQTLSRLDKIPMFLRDVAWRAREGLPYKHFIPVCGHCPAWRDRVFDILPDWHEKFYHVNTSR